MKHWLSVKEAADVMNCSVRTAYTRLRKLERELGRPVLVKRPSNGRTKTVVSAINTMRLSGKDQNLLELLEIKDTLDGLMGWAEQVTKQLKTISDRVGV